MENLDPISKEFLAEIDKVSRKYHRRIKIVAKFDEEKGVYPAFKIIEWLPEDETPTDDNVNPKETNDNLNVNQAPDLKEFETAEEPQGQNVEIAKKDVEA